MSACAATPCGSDPSVAAYEKLRRQVLAGTSVGGHFGLVLLLREGLAGWMSRRATSPLAPAAEAAPRAAAPHVFDQLQASVVQVLASMALRGLGGASS